MLHVLAILANLISLAAWLVMTVLLLASGANSSPKQITQIRIFLWSVAAITLLSLIASIWAFVQARLGLSIGIGILPAAACIGLLLWMLVTEW